MENNNNNMYFFWLSFLANLFQIANYEENIKQTSNDELMKALQTQNKQYLDTIIKQNELIIKLLEDKK